MGSATKTILITGGGRGLGRATAQQLAALGHRVVLTARNDASGARAVQEIRAAHPTSLVEARTVDLSDMDNVRRAGEHIAAEGWALDVLFNCAGVMQTHPVRQTTPDGFEQTLAVNVLAPFLLTHTLWPALLRSPAARVVNVSSRMHLPGSRGRPVDFDFEDPFMAHGYNPDRAYKNSKLAMLWFTYELQRRRAGRTVTANAVCPGFVPMTAAHSTHGFQAWLLRHVLVHMGFARSVPQAAASFVFMAISPALEGLGGGFYGDQKAIASSPESHDPAKARRFWDWASTVARTGAWP